MAESLPRIAEGRHRKKALLIISDGNDNSGGTNYWNVRRLVRRTEALVYAIGIDASIMQRLERIGGRGVSVRALRELTDDSGGRTEIIRHADDLDPATAGIARELSRQYQLAYSARHAGDGRWHSIRVEVRNPDHRVRARRGYVAAP